MKKTILNAALAPCIAAFACATAADAAVLYGNNFNGGDGGMTVVNSAQAPEGPWAYNAGTGSWRANGSENIGQPSDSALISPLISVPGGKAVSVGFGHRFSWEQDTVNWDGGQLRVSVNGGPFNAVPGASFTQNGYNGIINPGAGPILNGQEGYVGTSAGYANGDFITSVANLGEFNVGDSIQVELLAGWDWFSKGSVPNWELTGIEVSAVPEPSQVAMAGMTLLLGGWMALKRFRQRN
jgi:hypothetical protein